MSNTVFTLVTAQGTAAQSILTMLADARLIGSDKHTKLNEARNAILEVLPKLYAELNRMEKATRKNLWNVYRAIMKMYGRARWADHNQMMSILESTLEAYIEDAMAEVIAEEEAVEAVEAVSEPGVHMEDCTEVESVMEVSGISTYLGKEYRSTPTGAMRYMLDTEGKVYVAQANVTQWRVSAMAFETFKENLRAGRLVETCTCSNEALGDLNHTDH